MIASAISRAVVILWPSGTFDPIRAISASGSGNVRIQRS
jgi:hypothetical protein